ncbi:CRISPR-associated endoribonuclease Cas6 [Clostridium oceanicum]|uniref:CRISPR associated protein Cas6 C-terminal domain-containing protein n=1 Tax=Clostridium oceanicum TaxID=1543 RepID=A0ABP3US50_9CLOT
MRIKVNFEIKNNIDDKELKVKYSRNIYNHQIYSILINTLDGKKSKKIHDDKKMKRPFVFSDLFLNIEEKKGHFYICGESCIIEDFMKIKNKTLTLNNLKYKDKGEIGKLEDLIIRITEMEKEDIYDKLKPSEEYIFKAKFIVNIPKDVGKSKKRPRLLEDNEELKEKLRKITIDKAIDKKVITKEESKTVRLKFDFIRNKKGSYKRMAFAKYKNGYVASWKAKLKVKGDFKLIKFIYERAGIGENTSSGHGFIFLDRGDKNARK